MKGTIWRRRRGTATAAVSPADGKPLACLRVIDDAGVQTDQMQLDGAPMFLGDAVDEHGVRYAGVALAIGPGHTLMLDTCSPAWLDALVSAASRAYAALEYGGMLPAAEQADVAGVA